MLSLCVPVKVIRQAEFFANGLKVNSQSEKFGQRDETRNSNSVQLVAQLTETKIASDDLVGLRVGDIINTEQSVDTPIVVSVDGKPKYRASLGALKGRKAIRIEEAIVETSPSVPKMG